MKAQERRIQGTSNKLQAEISQLRTAIEVAKLDVVKLSVGPWMRARHMRSRRS